MRVAVVVADRAAVHRQRVVVQHAVLCELADDDGQAARLEEVFHQGAARRHDVDEAVHVATEPIPVVKAEIDADAARDRDQLHDGVRRSADAGVHADRVLERRAREDLRERHLLFHHLDDAPSGVLRLAITARVYGGYRRIAG